MSYSRKNSKIKYRKFHSSFDTNFHKKFTQNERKREVVRDREFFDSEFELTTSLPCQKTVVDYAKENIKFSCRAW